MKTTHPSLVLLRSVVLPAFLSLTVYGLAIRPAQAGYVVALLEVGPDVVGTGSGVVDLAGLTFNSTSTGNFGPFISGALGLIRTGQFGLQSVDQFTGFTGPTSFGNGGLITANNGSGNLVGINGSNGFMSLPQGYVSGAALSDSMIFNNATLANLGLTPGTYEWTWGIGANQNFTVQIGAATVPDSGSTFALLVLALLGLFAATHLRSLRAT
jgi:hypothetical protein